LGRPKKSNIFEQFYPGMKELFSGF